MSNTSIITEHAHAGHSHGHFGELVEQIFDATNLSHSAKEFFTHLVVDTLNVFFLLIVVMTAVYFISSYINMDKLHDKLKSLKSIWGFGLAIFIGLLSPFCSCSVIPVLMGFISVGVPVSVCLCYLTASSMINITALISIYAVTGWKFALLYLLCSIAIVVISSIFFSIIKLDNGVKHYHGHDHHENDGCETFLGRIKNALLDTFGVFKKCALWVILGVALSSYIMVYFSIESISSIVNSNSFLSTTIVALIGIPIHSDIFSVAPLITLLMKISPSLALTFTFSTMAISLPSVIILTRVLKTKTVLIYCGTIAALALIIGYIGLLF